MRLEIPNECVGAIYRKVAGIVDKIENGGLDYQHTLNGLQAVFENRWQPVAETTSAVASAEPITVLPVVFKTADTDLNFWLGKCQEFAKKFIGVEVDLGRFIIPAELPWKSVIPVFDPGGMTNRQAVQKALKDSGLTVWEEVDVMKYGGSQASKEPTLHFIQNSARPDGDTMGMSPDQLVATGKNWLSQRGYILAFGLYPFVTGEYLDPQTWTWFPNCRLSPSRVASGDWNPDYAQVKLDWYYSDYGHGYTGSRLAMPISLRS